jgi:trans-aconitate methyltransferase
MAIKPKLPQQNNHVDARNYKQASHEKIFNRIYFNKENAMLSGKNTFFLPSTYHESCPQTSFTMNVVEYALKSRPLTGDEVIIDARCRTGKFATELSRRLHGKGRVIGYDDAEEMIAFANSKKKKSDKVTYIHRDFTCAAITFEDEADIVISAWHLPFIPEEKQQAYLQTLKNRIKPGGRLIITYPEAHSSLSKAIDAVVVTDPWVKHFKDIQVQSSVVTDERLQFLLTMLNAEEALTTNSNLKHQFTSKKQLMDFIASMLVHHLSHLKDHEDKQKFTEEVANTYLKSVEHKENRIPYIVSVKTVTAKQAEYTHENVYSMENMRNYL